MTPDLNVQTAMQKYSQQLDSIQKSALKPVQAGQARERVLVDAITHLMDMVGPGVDKLHCIDSVGEIMLAKSTREGGTMPWGQKLAGILSNYPTRCGTNYRTVELSESEGWTRIHHFTAEKIVRDLGKGIGLEVGDRSPADLADSPSP
jgi:hypothetical protein